MNSRIQACFAKLRAKHQKGFIAYITAGDPSLKETIETVLLLEQVGVDIVELGVPFSDPLADGPVNQEAAARALRAGTTFAGIVKCVRAIRRRSDIPLVLFSYLNPLICRGFERSARQAAAAGVDGFLMVDLPVEEADPYVRVLRRHGLDHIGLVAPTSPPERIRRIVARSSGFVYGISREGVTGMQKRLAPSALRLIRQTRGLTELPVAIGFGISTAIQARAAATAADAVVVGSAIVDRLARSSRNPAGRAAVASWVRTLVRAVKER